MLVILDKTTHKEDILAEDIATHLVKCGDWVYYLKTKDYTKNSAGILHKVNINTHENLVVLEENVKGLQMNDDFLYFTLRPTGEKNYFLYQIYVVPFKRKRELFYVRT